MEEGGLTVAKGGLHCSSGSILRCGGDVNSQWFESKRAEKSGRFGSEAELRSTYRVGSGPKLEGEDMRRSEKGRRICWTFNQRLTRGRTVNGGDGRGNCVI
ncbi:hypothetical protein CRG98_001567 [Punica granatum]|uniref:Uncharacterized protein n=1 Tax=Punica granatum TaxID=22663 RepID=A0A2I0LB92_PUNGR|nr:hypothetical protein CRG98_001567 [Punica granatum]